jgi:Conserved region in glutamate synthase
MFAVGCIQAQQCHTDRCPTGVATQDLLRQRAISVPAKSERVASFHKETVKALAQLVAAAGLYHPKEFKPHHFMQRAAPDRTLTFAELYKILEPGELIKGTTKPLFAKAWNLAQAESFAPLVGREPKLAAAAAE